MQQHLSKGESNALKSLKFDLKVTQGNSVVLVDQDKYIEWMENVLSDQSKFYKIALKDDNFLNFITSQEKCTDKIYKKFVDSNSISEETRRHLKLERTRPEIMYGYCKKKKKKCVDGSLPFRPYLSALETPT